MAEIFPSYSYEYYIDQDLHLQFLMDTEKKEAALGSGIQENHNAVAYPPIGDPWWNTQENLWETVVVPETIEYNNETYVVTAVSAYAFYKFTNIKHISLPKNIRSVGNSAFHFCVNLETVEFSGNVKTIGESCFQVCYNLKSLSLPSSVNSIGKAAFSDCYGLEEVNIPSSCTKVGIDAFTACRKLTKLIIEDGTEPLQFTYSNAIAIDYEATMEDKDDARDHIRGQFADCPLNTLYLGRNVTFPREYYDRWKGYKTLLPFERCSEYRYNLQNSNKYLFFSPAFTKLEFGNNVTEIPDSLFLTTIDSFYYLGGGSIENEIILPANLKSVGVNAFCRALYGTHNLVIPESVETIQYGAFSNNNIIYLTLPTGKLDIGPLSFAYGSIKKLIIPDSDITIGSSAFASNVIEELILPNRNIPIGTNAFANNNIEQINIPDKFETLDGFKSNKICDLIIPSAVTHIASGAFAGNPLRFVHCNTLTPPADANPFSDATIYVPSGTGGTYRQQWSDAAIVDNADEIISINVRTAGTLYSRLLAQDYNVNDVCKLKLKGTLNDDDLTIINEMSNLYYLDLSEMQVEEVANGLFQKISRLETVKLPNTLTSIRDDEFKGCTSLTGSLLIPASCTTIGKKAFADTGIDSFTYTGSISIGDSAFVNCYRIHEVELSSGTQVGKAAFQATRINKITVESGVSIGEDAFKNTGLREAILENGVDKIADGAFGDELEKITFNGSVAYIGNIFGGRLSEVHVSDVVTWCQMPFTDEGPMRFSPRLYIGEEEVTNITVPNTVGNLRNNAFLNCKSLTSVTLSVGVKSIGDNAFKNCYNMVAIVLPNTITNIGEQAFEFCQELNTAKLPSALSALGAYAFRGCSKLVDVEIPASLGVINEATFKDCSSLTNLRLSNSITSIDKSAFAGCSSLSKLDLPESITSMEQFSFDNCSALKSVAVHWDNPITITDVFTSIPSDCYLYCPINTASKYFNAGWDIFPNLKEAGILSITANEGGTVRCYDETISNGTDDIYFTPYRSFNIILTPNEGYVIRKVKLNGENIIS